jgi:predicted Zn-dependent protease
MPLARASVLVLPLLACAWFAVGIRQAHDTAAATSIISRHGAPSARQAAHARSLLQAADTLNPDSQVELLRARLAFLEGDRTSATRSVLTVVGEEPENVQAWLLLAEVANDNKRLADRALINVVRLDPRG